MRALVTGGLGFIGSHVADRLLSDGWDVTAVDNLSAGRRSNLLHHRGNPKLHVVRADIRSPTIHKLLKRFDAVFHLAAHADIRKSLADHRADLDSNLLGTLNLLEGMLKHGVPDLVFASTSAIYGEATVIPTPEEYMPVQTSLYGASKMSCEAFCQAYTQLAPIRVWAFRFANVIGERCRRGVVWDFVHKLRSNPNELEILGDGKQSKEYLYVNDCVEGMMCGYGKASAAFNPFNLGVEQQTAVDRVADLVITELGLGNVRKRYTGGRSGWIGDNPHVELSLERIKSLGWLPRVTSEEAIRRTTIWTVQNLRG